MSKIKLNVLFKKIQKDDKKEVLEFHVQGNELPSTKELVGLAGSIAILNVLESKAGEFNAEFVSVQKDSKKTTLKFNIKGDSDDKVIKLYPHAGQSVSLILEPSQMSIEEFNEPHEGIEYEVGQDGTAKVAANQISMDEVEKEDEGQDPVELETEDPFSEADKPSDDELE